MFRAESSELSAHTHTHGIMFGNRQTYKWRSCDLCPMRNHQDIRCQCLRVQSRFYTSLRVQRTLQFTIINLPMNILRRRKTSRRRKMVRAAVHCSMTFDGHDLSCRVLPQLPATIQTFRMIFLHLIATHIFACDKPHRHTYSLV